MIVDTIQETCCNSDCGIVFWIEKQYQQILVTTKRSFYCPNGHSMSYTGESDKQKIERLKKEKIELEASKNFEIEDLKKQLKKKCRNKKTK